MSLPMNIQGQVRPGKEAAVTLLTDEEIWEQVSKTRFARLGTIGQDSFAHITPVNVVSDGESIFFRTAAGSKLLHLTLEGKATLQLDRVEGDRAVSINLFCTACQVTDSQKLAYIETLQLRTWVETEKLEVIQLTPVKLTGRRFRLAS